MKVITPAGLVERLKISCSLARAACKLLCEEGKIAPVEVHNKQLIYTRVSA
jgi:ribosomal protein S25